MGLGNLLVASILDDEEYDLVEYGKSHPGGNSHYKSSPKIKNNHFYILPNADSAIAHTLAFFFFSCVLKNGKMPLRVCAIARSAWCIRK